MRPITHDRPERYHQRCPWGDLSRAGSQHSQNSQNSPSPPSAITLLISASFSTRLTISPDASFSACNPACSCCFCRSVWYDGGSVDVSRSAPGCADALPYALGGIDDSRDMEGGSWSRDG